MRAFIGSGIKESKRMRTLKDKRAVSPVIATVVLVAVAITVAVAVAYWMGGIAAMYTKFEKVEIQSAYAPKEATCWNITLVLKNTGSANATLNNVFINNKPIDQYSPTINCTQVTSGTGLTIASGQQVTLYIQVPLTGLTFTSGTTLNVKLHSAGGMDYIKLVELT